VAVVAEPEGLAHGELTAATALQARTAAEAVAASERARDGRVALVGVSGGGTLALLAAAGPELAARATTVVVLAPVCDVGEAIRVVTTGVRREGDALVPATTADFFRLVIARSVVGWLDPGPDRAALRAHLLALEDYGSDPLGGLRAWPRSGLGPAARAVVALLANEDPARFDPLLAALPADVGDHVRTLSPVSGASRISAPVELVVAREDKYIPFADATSFAEACTRARLTVLDSLAHAVPSLSPAHARDLARLHGVLARLVAASYSRP
jgi:pimeloyl-ACP methyl ester carboxylesterase